MTRTGITADMVGILAAPTPPDEIEHRPGPGNRSLSYVSARFVMNRLDEIGGENWQDRYEDRPNGSVRCGIGILIDGEWVWKWDVGDESDIEANKGAHSGAFKRAGVKWGIARDLYGDATTHAAPGLPARPAAPSRPTPASSASGGELQEPEHLRDAFYEPRELPVTPQGAIPGGECPMHHLAWQLRPGGTSKTTGKPYDPFWACPSTERPFCKEKPSRAWAARQEVA
jgi:hypothetical protein